MNYLEKKMRYSNAFSSLNSLRNILQFDGSSVMDPVEKAIILDAIEIAIDATQESFSKALMYGFYNTGDTIKSSALELAKVISEGVERCVFTAKDADDLRKILNSEITLSERGQDLMKIIDNLMILLNKAKKDEVAISNTLLVKSFINL